jgi:hypothetical protein
MGSSYSLTQQTQQWLDETKLPIGTLDPVLVETATEMVFSRVSRVYDVTGWQNSGPPIAPNQSACPSLVQKAISLLLACWLYARAYSEVTDEEENKYAARLESMAEDLTAGIEGGIISLTDANPATFIPADEPDFMPAMADNAAPVVDALGYVVGREGSNQAKFTMSRRF